MWGMYNAGLSWRYYGPQRVVGGFGVASSSCSWDSPMPSTRRWSTTRPITSITRRVNSVVLPVVWQPHVYVAKKHLRVYLEAAATFSYNFSSTYENELAREQGKEDWHGDYRFHLARDNRWGYGLAGGGGVAILVSRFELNFRVRYYFGFSDLLRNRTRYADNLTDGSENPFRNTPLRSPLDNLNIGFGVSYRFNRTGFESWKPRPKRERNREVFKYEL